MHTLGPSPISVALALKRTSTEKQANDARGMITAVGDTEKTHTCSVSGPSAALATEVHCEVQKHSDKEEEENEGQTRGSLLETH